MILRRNPFHRFSKFSNLWNYIGKRNLYQTGEFEWSSFLPEDTYDSFSENSSHGPKLCEKNKCEYLIVGGGIMGQSLAYNLWRTLENSTPVKAAHEFAAQILLIEKDPTLQESSTLLSVGGIRTQFSQSANVQLSMLTADFMKNINQHLQVAGGEEVDIQLNPRGYLMLATENGCEQLMENYETQKKAGAKIQLFNEERLKQIYPWLNTEGIVLGSLGIENEGWFDPSLYVNAFKNKLKTFPVKNITGKVVGSKLKQEEVGENYTQMVVDGVYIELPDVDKPVFIKSRKVINCAGADAAQFAEFCGVGLEAEDGDPLLVNPLPVERRKRYVYVVHCPDAPMMDMPMVCDPSGFYIRREGLGGKYICGKSPQEDCEPTTDDLSVDHDYFQEEIWPSLAHRIPAFEKLKVTSAWAGYYDYNTFDQNAIIGPHPVVPNLFFLNGFSGHGIQQAYGASLALSEMLVKEEAVSADVSAFSFNRIPAQVRFLEKNII